MPITNAAHRIDVVIPVYGNLPSVRRCLESVMSSRGEAVARIIVVDDASPHPELAAYLNGLAGQGLIEVIRHAHNQGVVAANNTGVAASRNDVAMLNSDVEVHGDWASRLLNAAYAAADIGTVTPFSNEGSICSYPYPTWWRGLPGGMSTAELDSLFARVNTGATADLPSGVSFCMLVKRAVFERVGLFDVEAFGRGYGDETDFCQRVVIAGWRNVICADTFVYHEGGSSFGPQRVARAEAAERILKERYPDYQGRVRDFTLEDPLRIFRERVDAARAQLSTKQALAVLEERAAEKTWLLRWLAHEVKKA